MSNTRKLTTRKWWCTIAGPRTAWLSVALALLSLSVPGGRTRQETVDRFDATAPRVAQARRSDRPPPPLSEGEVRVGVDARLEQMHDRHAAGQGGTPRKQRDRFHGQGARRRDESALPRAPQLPVAADRRGRAADVRH